MDTRTNPPVLNRNSWKNLPTVAEKMAKSKQVQKRHKLKLVLALILLGTLLTALSTLIAIVFLGS